MDFKALHYVIAISEAGSFTGAAQMLGISQPSLSKYIQNMNSSLGIRLFKRDGIGLSPTYAGQIYIESARHLLQMSQELFDAGAQEYQDDERGIIKIASPPFEGPHVSSLIVEKFKDSFPQYNIMLVESAQISSLLRSNEVNLAITNYPIEDSAIHCEQIRQYEILLVTFKDHPIISSAELRNDCSYPWLNIELFEYDNFAMLFPNQRTRILVDRLLSEKNISPRILLQTRSLATAISMAAAGQAISFAPEYQTSFYRFEQEPKFFSVGNPLIGEIYLAYLKGAEQVATNCFFMDLIRKYY